MSNDQDTSPRKVEVMTKRLCVVAKLLAKNRSKSRKRKIAQEVIKVIISASQITSEHWVPRTCNEGIITFSLSGMTAIYTARYFASQDWQSQPMPGNSLHERLKVSSALTQRPLTAIERILIGAVFHLYTNRAIITDICQSREEVSPVHAS